MTPGERLLLRSDELYPVLLATLCVGVLLTLLGTSARV